MSLRRPVSKWAFFLLFALTSGCWLLIQLYISRRFAPVARGRFSYYRAVENILVPLASCGVNVAVLRQLVGKKLKLVDWRPVLLRVALITFIVTSTGTLVSFLAGVAEPWYLLLCGTSLSSALLILTSAFLARSQMKFVLAVAIEKGHQVVFLLLIVLSAATTSAHAVLAELVALLSVLVPVMIWTARAPVGENPLDFRMLLGEGALILASNMTLTVASNVDRLITYAALGESSAGLYFTVLSAYSPLTLLTAAIGYYLVPLYRSDARRQRYQKIVRAALVGFLATAFGYHFAAGWLIRRFLPDAIKLYEQVGIGVSTVFFLRMIYPVVSSRLVAIGSNDALKTFLLGNGVLLVLIIALQLLLVVRFGLPVVIALLAVFWCGRLGLVLARLRSMDRQT